MRWLASFLVIAGVVVVVTACTEHGKGGGVFCFFMGDTHQPGDQFPAGDGCNTCSCDIDGNVLCSEIACTDGGLPDGANACAPSGGCSNGPLCGGSCCEIGETCLNGSICSCGGNAPCSNGDICSTGGPVGGGFCGSICCGTTTPCPI